MKTDRYLTDSFEYITICGVIALVLVIIGFIMPVIGPGFIVPIALIFLQFLCPERPQE